MVRELRDRAAVAGSPLLLAVSGGSGIGKSTLVVTVAYELGATYADVLYSAAASAAPSGIPDSADAVADLLVQLGVPWRDLPEPSLRLPVLRSLVGGRQLLIVLDNVYSDGQVLPLLGDLRNGAVVVAGERHLEQLRVEGFEPLKLKGFGPEEGAAYLSAIAGAAVADAEPAVLHRLVTLCGGVPRLIGAAATRLADGEESVREYVDRLERAATVAEIADDLSIDNISVVDAVCDASYQGLTDEEARAYRWLSLYPGSTFDLDGAAGLLEVPRPKAQRLVRELVDRSLVQPHGDGIFEFPHVIRRHAIDTARAVDVSPDSRAVLMRAVDECTKRAAGLALSISDRPIPAVVAGDVFHTVGRRHHGDTGVDRAYAEFAACWPTFIEAARRAIELDMHAAAITLPIALWPFAYHTYRVTELLDAYRTVLDIADDPNMNWPALGDAAPCWQLARDLGALYERRGELEAAGAWFERAAGTDYPPGRASGLEWQGIVCERQGRHGEALARFDAAEAALVLIPDSEVRERSAELLRMHKGRNLVVLGRGDQAESLVRVAESYFRLRPADVTNAARCRLLLGDIAWQRGDADAAQENWEAGLADLMRYRMRYEAAVVHDKLAELTARQGCSDAAQQHHEQAARLRPEL
jgi:tetratricopeptide (TPR) repeat protein